MLLYYINIIMKNIITYQCIRPPSYTCALHPGKAGYLSYLIIFLTATGILLIGDVTITIPDTSETGFCLHLEVEPTQFVPTDRASL
jgi:hypothetical protein